MSVHRKQEKLTQADEEWWVRRHERMTGVHCRWSPDLDVNGIGPLVQDPDNLSRASLRRNRLLLNMHIVCGDLTTARKIIAAYPQLRAEYETKIQARAKQLRA